MALVMCGGDDGQHDLIAQLRRRCVNFLGQLALEGAADVHGDAEVLGATEFHQAGGAVGAVAKLLCRCEDPGPRRLARACAPRNTMETSAVETPAARAT